MSKPNWLPNLVGGVSIWKLAQDLNQQRFFDGRLLVPETEGSESLPTTVTWDVASLVPLREARAKHPAETDKAVKDFLACLDVVSKELASSESGYFKFKDALTFPSGLDGAGEDGAYFFDPASGKLKVINWGASPREIAGSQKLVFGWEDWGALRKAGAAAGVAGVVAAAAGGEKQQEGGKDGKGEQEKKKEEEKKEEEKKGRPWWHWLLVALAGIALLVLILWLLRSCAACNPTAQGADGATDGLVEGAVVTDAALEAGDATLDGDATPEAATDANVEAGDAGDAGDGGDGGKKKDGAVDDDDDDDDTGGGGGGGGGSGGGGGGGSGGGSGGKPGTTDRPKLHAVHPDAVRWRITKGTELLHKGSPVDGTGPVFDVTLKRGKSFHDVIVQWQDKKGVWHTF